MWEKELEVALNAANLVKSIILDVYKTPFQVEIKDDNSPVTKADKLSDAAIREYISARYKDHAFLTEESFDDKSRLNNDYVWIIDPLDGTADFVDKNGEFTVNIALSYKHKIVVGAVLIPVTGEVYYATRHGGAFYVNSEGSVREIHVNHKHDNLTVLISKFHVKKEELDTIKKHADIIKKIEAHGSSIKPCLIARGDAELSYRFSSGTKEWDTASAQLIVEEAGGVFVKPDGSPITYNRDDVYNREGYIIANHKRNILL